MQSDGAALTQLIKNLAALSDVAIAHQPAVQSLLAQLPTFVSSIADTANGGSVAVNIFYNSSESICPYVSGANTPAPTAKTGAPSLTRTCSASAPDLLQRGAANAGILKEADHADDAGHEHAERTRGTRGRRRDH